MFNVSGRTSFSTCPEGYSDSYSALCTRPDCGLHGGSAKVGQDPTQKVKAHIGVIKFFRFYQSRLNVSSEIISTSPPPNLMQRYAHEKFK